MSFILVAALFAAEGKTQELINAILPIVKDAQQEKGCLQYQFAQSAEEPRRVMLWEEYESEEAFQEHLQGKNFQALAARFRDLIEGEPSMKRYNVLDRFH